MQVYKGIYQVGGSLNGITWTGQDTSYDDCNVYVFENKGQLIMFDCGCGETLEQIFTNMRIWGLDPKKLKACFLTHSHWDHAGAAHILKKMGVKIYAHKITADSVAAGDERCCGYLYHKEFVPCEVDIRLDDKEVVKEAECEIRTMHLPGHTQGCTAYFLEWDGKSFVVSGDVIGTLLDGYFGWNGSYDFDKQKYLETLRRFSKIDTDIMLPGHGMIYFHQPRRRVEEAFNQALCQWR